MVSFNLWKKLESLKKTTDLYQVTEKLYYAKLDIPPRAGKYRAIMAMMTFIISLPLPPSYIITPSKDRPSNQARLKMH